MWFFSMFKAEYFYWFIISNLFLLEIFFIDSVFFTTKKGFSTILYDSSLIDWLESYYIYFYLSIASFYHFYLSWICFWTSLASLSWASSYWAGWRGWRVYRLTCWLTNESCLLSSIFLLPKKLLSLICYADSEEIIFI